MDSRLWVQSRLGAGVTGAKGQCPVTSTQRAYLTRPVVPRAESPTLPSPRGSSRGSTRFQLLLPSSLPALPCSSPASSSSSPRSSPAPSLELYAVPSRFPCTSSPQLRPAPPPAEPSGARLLPSYSSAPSAAAVAPRPACSQFHPNSSRLFPTQAGPRILLPQRRRLPEAPPPNSPRPAPPPAHPTSLSSSPRLGPPTPPSTGPVRPTLLRAESPSPSRTGLRSHTCAPGAFMSLRGRGPAVSVPSRGGVSPMGGLFASRGTAACVIMACRPWAEHSELADGELRTCVAVRMGVALPADGRRTACVRRCAYGRAPSGRGIAC